MLYKKHPRSGTDSKKAEADALLFGTGLADLDGSAFTGG